MHESYLEATALLTESMRGAIQNNERGFAMDVTDFVALAIGRLRVNINDTARDLNKDTLLSCLNEQSVQGRVRRCCRQSKPDKLVAGNTRRVLQTSPCSNGLAAQC
jgi:hypothetical protein